MRLFLYFFFFRWMRCTADLVNSANWIKVQKHPSEDEKDQKLGRLPRLFDTMMPELAQDGKCTVKEPYENKRRSKKSWPENSPTLIFKLKTNEVHALCKAGKAKSLSVNQIQTNCFWPPHDWMFWSKRKSQLKKDKNWRKQNSRSNIFTVTRLHHIAYSQKSTRSQKTAHWSRVPLPINGKNNLLIQDFTSVIKIVIKSLEKLGFWENVTFKQWNIIRLKLNNTNLLAGSSFDTRPS